jgi:hypothetical protein
MERSSQSRSIKQATNQPLGARCDYYGARLSQRLEASGKIGGFADDHLLLGRAHTDGPVAMAMRTCKRTPAAVSSFGTASTNASPARTERSASCSSVCGYPK